MKKLALLIALLIGSAAQAQQIGPPSITGNVPATFSTLAVGGCVPSIFCVNGAMKGTSLALGGATIGSNALAVTGTSNLSGNVTLGAGVNLIWSGRTSISALNTGVFQFGTSNNSFVSQITIPATNVLQFGSNDVASPAAMTLQFQNGSGTNIAGVNATIIGPLGTGTGTNGDIIFQTGVKTGSGTTQGTPTTALTIKGESLQGIFASSISATNAQITSMASDSGLTDNSVCITSGGTLYKGSGVAGICVGTSSMRFKHDIAPLDAGLPQIMGLEAVKYKLNADHGDPDKTLYGFTAEQGGTVLPQLVGKDTAGKPQTFDYMGVVPVLVKAIQEQQAEIEALKKRLH